MPRPDEVLVRVHATTVNRTDCGELLHPTLTRLLSGAGRSRRNILGLDFAGSGRVVIHLAKRGSGQAFVNELREKIDAGRFIPAIDRRYPLTAIADAYRYVQTGEKASMVVIDVVRGGRPTQL